MNLAILTSLYPSPGSPFEGIFAERRWLGMQSRGHAVRVTHPIPLTPGPFAFGKWRVLRDIPRRENREGIEVGAPRYLHLPGLAMRNARQFARTGLREILAQGRPDAIVCDYAWPASVAALELADMEIPCVISGRGSDILEVAGEAGLGDELKRCLKAAGNWCAVSRHLLETMDRLGEGAGTLVPNGVDTELFQLRDAAQARAELDWNRTGPLVIVVGHLIPRKDPLLALAAFAEGAPETAQLAFVGAGELYGELECDIAERGLAGRVTLVGAEPPERLALWYSAADCLLLTSRREGRPNVVLEALASGCPVLATEAGGTGELLEAMDGMLVPASVGRDSGELGRRLQALLSRQHDAAQLRGAVLDLSWERSLDALEACIHGAREDFGATRSAQP